MTAFENKALYMVLLVGFSVAVVGNLISIIIAHHKKKKLLKPIASLVVSALLLTGSAAFIISHPTYYKYNDSWIKGRNTFDVQNWYGKYDYHELGWQGYYIYTDANGDRHYYCIHIDIEGYVHEIEDRIIDA